jgi:hypothetical protein
MQLFTQGLESMFGDFSVEELLTQELARTIDHIDAQDDRSDMDQAVGSIVSPVRPPGPEHPSMSWEGFDRVPASEHQMSEANSSASAVQRGSTKADHASVPFCPGVSVRSAKGPIRSMSSQSQELHHVPSHEPSHETFHAMPPLPVEAGPTHPHAKAERIDHAHSADFSARTIGSSAMTRVHQGSDDHRQIQSLVIHVDSASMSKDEGSLTNGIEQSNLHHQYPKPSLAAVPAHVPFHAKPHLPEDEGPSQSFFIATIQEEIRHPKRRRMHVATQDAYSPAGGVASFAAKEKEYVKETNPPERPNARKPQAADAMSDAEDPVPAVRAELERETAPEASFPEHPKHELPKATGVKHEEAKPKSVITVLVGMIHGNVHEVQVVKGTTVGQLVLAEGRMIDERVTWRPTNAMGLPVPIASLLDQDDVVFLSDIAHPLPVIKFHEHQFACGCPDKQDRLHVLWNQQGWVATDEMTFYLRLLQDWGLPTAPPIVAYNCCDLNDSLAEWVLTVIEKAHQAQKQVTMRTAILLNQHWTPVMIQASPEALAIHTTPAGQELLQTLPDIVSFDEAEWHCDTVRSKFPFDCGFQAFAWLQGYASGGIAMPMSVIQATAMRHEFAKHCLHQDVTFPFALGGIQDDKHVPALQALVETHGVSPLRSQSVAMHLIAVLGSQSIGHTLQAPKPWKDLKTKANMQKPPIQIVLTDELQAAVADRVKHGQVIGKRNNRKTVAQAKAPIVLRADKIAVPDAIFQQSDGVQIGQLTVHQIQSNAKGVVVVNVQDALPFFQLNEPVSSEGVALLILDHQDVRIPDPKQMVKFPAHFCDTDEPILVTAAMLQIGSKPVQRHRPDTCVKIDEVPTQVVRLLTYRDQAKMDWASIVEGPMKALLTLETLAFLEQDQILGIWNRQYLDKSFKKTPAKDAYLFAATLRLKTGAAQELLALSGKDGLYSEPRTDNGRAPDSAFRVIWLPRKTFAEATLINQTTHQKSWLVRSGDRLGLRVKEEDASDVHMQHRPEVSYLDGTSVMEYKVGPLPWGTTKVGLQKAFKQWQWPARPGQPQGQSNDGVFWSAQATQHPSHWVFTMAHGDVLISHKDPLKAAKTNKESSVIASTKTLKQMATPMKKVVDQSTTDPWLNVTNDPWAQAPTKAPTQALTSAQIAQMQSTIEQNIRDTLAPMEDAAMDGATDSRVSALEEQVKQLTTSVGQLTGNMHTLHNQQQQLGTQVHKMQTHMDHQHASLQSMIDGKLEAQMSRIEALFSKRAKTAE